MPDRFFPEAIIFKGDAAIVAVAITALLLAAAAVLLVFALRRGGPGSREKRLREEQSANSPEAQLSELKGRFAQLAELTVLRQEELARALDARLDRLGEALGTRVEDSGRHTSGHLSKLHERLNAIDMAQQNIAELSGRVLSLQDVLASKQARGAFGQARMEAIVEDGLPKGSYSFQRTLSNGKRPDCLIHLPYATAGIAVDAKFPLENFEALRLARSDAGKREAQAAVRRDISRHIEDISSKYFIPGETQDTALLFVPSESVYAELHEGFPDLIQKAYRARIVIVSPNMMMLAVQTIMTILKDARMREQAGVIQAEVSCLLQEVKELGSRILDFQRQFGQLGTGLEKIRASSEKVAGRAVRIEGAGLKDPKPPEASGAAHDRGEA